MSTAAETLSKQHYVMDDGSVRVVEYGDGVAPAPVTGGRAVTEAEYTSALAAIQQANAEQASQVQATETANAKADYDALIAAGLPAATARRLSNYTPED